MPVLVQINKIVCVYGASKQLKGNEQIKGKCVHIKIEPTTFCL